MGKWFLTDNLATVGRVLMTYSAHPHEISILINGEKISPPARLRASKLRITRIANFGLFLPKSAPVFLSTLFFL